MAGCFIRKIWSLLQLRSVEGVRGTLSCPIGDRWARLDHASHRPGAQQGSSDQGSMVSRHIHVLVTLDPPTLRSTVGFNRPKGILASNLCRLSRYRRPHARLLPCDTKSDNATVHRPQPCQRPQTGDQASGSQFDYAQMVGLVRGGRWRDLHDLGFWKRWIPPIARTQRILQSHWFGWLSHKRFLHKRTEKHSVWLSKANSDDQNLARSWNKNKSNTWLDNEGVHELLTSIINFEPANQTNSLSKF